jgi:hypothetical protein
MCQPMALGCVLDRNPGVGLVTLRQTFAYRRQVSPCGPELRAPMQQPPPFGGVVFGDRLNLFALNARPTT